MRATRVAKAAHLALAPAGWLMAILRAVVYSCGCFDENVLDLREFRDVSLRCRITAQLISHDLPRHRVRSQHTSKKALGRGLVAPLLYQHVEFCAMLVDGTPQQIRLAAQRHEHLVNVPRVAWLAPHRLGASGESSTEFVTPTTDRFVRDHDASLEQQFFDVAQAQAVDRNKCVTTRA